MYVKKIKVINFRLLEEITISLYRDVTLIVGRNNSGKTSLTDIFYSFLGGDKSKFKFEDFPISSHSKFTQALQIWNELKEISAKDEEQDILSKKKEFKNAIPIISISLTIEYEEDDNLASLAPFIMDLDEHRKDVCISIEYSPIDSEKMFKNFDTEKEQDIIKFIKRNFNQYYNEKIFAVDNMNIEYKRLIIKKSLVYDLFMTSFIYAQRHIDDQAVKNSEKLSKNFEEYYNNHYKDTDINQQFQNTLDGTSKEWDTLYEKIFQTLLKDLSMFGYPGLNSHELKVKSHFDVAKVLKGHTNVYYQYNKDNLLPEAYNGLGFKNLIYIILQLITFYERYRNKEPHPGFQLLFIEEPEVHLHPQMQYTFIKNIKHFVQSKLGWNVQIIITTHSSHIISESGFDSIRYFDNLKSAINVKNLQELKLENKDTRKFLTQYMSLNNCDMFFADKIIMVEGTVERLLLQLMIKKFDKKHKTSLSSQYISLIEIGGSHAHNFREILEFMGVKTLIITDIDTINSKDKRKKCKVPDGDKTCNQILIQWIPEKESKDDLLACSDIEKEKENIRVSYQIPETAAQICGRSFEEAFILKNALVLANNTLIANKEIFNKLTEQAIKSQSYELANSLSGKTDFAFDIMLLEEWELPKYIEEGLLWLNQ